MNPNPPRINNRTAKLECLKLAVSGLMPVSAANSKPADRATSILETAKEFYEWVGESNEEAP